MNRLANGTKVRIKKGQHSLEPNTIGEIVGFEGQMEGEFAVYNVKGDSALHFDRMIVNDLLEIEFEIIDKPE